MLRLLFILAALMMLGMVFGPMRRHILRRLDITATILLIVLPLLAAGRLLYTVRQGGWEERDDIAFVVLIVSALIGLWIGLWWLTNMLGAAAADSWRRATAVSWGPSAAVVGTPGRARGTGGRSRAQGPRLGTVHRPALGARRGAAAAPRQGQSKPASSPAAPVGRQIGGHAGGGPGQPPRPDHGQATAASRQLPDDQPPGAAPPRRRAASASKMDDAAMTLGRIGGHLFGKAEKATRPKSSSSRRRRK